MSKRNIEVIYPLSPMQEGMLFHSLYSPGSGIYVEQFRSTLRGDIDIDAFIHAWQQVVQRQSVLRTAFTWKRLDRMLQVVQRQVELPIEVQDWREFTDQQQAENLRSYLESDREAGFDLSSAPLLRLALFQISKDAFYFILTLHHIIIDGWSLPFLLREVLSIYESNRKGHEVKLSSTRPYRDFIKWVQKQDQTAAETFWRRSLKDFKSPTPLMINNLPIKNRASEVESFSAAAGEDEINLSSGTTDRLWAISKKYRVTLSTIIQAAWAVLLSRYSREQDVLFGVTVSGRPPAINGVESMVGLFINTLPLRAQVRRGERVSTWLQDLQSQAVETRQYEYSSLVNIQQWSEIPSGTPLFDSILVFENYPVDKSLREQNLSIQFEDIISSEKTNYPLTLVTAPSDNLLIKVSYDQNAFDHTLIRSLLGHIKTILQSIAINPEQLVGDIEILSDAERDRLLFGWSRTEKGFHEERSLQAIFESQVEKTPLGVAVEYVDGDNKIQLSYEELNRRSNKLAHYLRRIGVVPETLVGIFLERSVDMIVGLLGIIKAGGAYLPLSPNYPDDRLIYMIKDSNIQFMISQEDLVERLPGIINKVLCLDREWENILEETDNNPACVVSPHNLVYVIYTSGSTGRSKGVQITHQGLVNHARTAIELYELNQSDRVLQFITLSFDASGEEIYPALLSGATLVLIKSAEEMLGEKLIRFCGSQDINVLHLPTTIWHQMVDEISLDERNLAATLRLLVVGGDSPDVDRISKWISIIGQPVRFINAYGPTEATITSTYYEIKDHADFLDNYTFVPIGRPIPNVRTFILDAQLKPVPVGIPGELYIGGVGVARGYRNRPELSVSSFLSDPISIDPGARMYKTGDLARFLPDSNIEFLGRADFQVKIRGFRIELGEIEIVLQRHPDIRNTAVLIWGEEKENKYLVAYVESVDGVPVDVGSLRKFLGDKLPNYMVPATFVLLENLPLLPNGKVNRNALQPPDDGQIRLEEEYVAPRSPVESMLSEIWTQVLGVEKIGIADNFFELGGHSLLATQVVSRIRNVMKVDIPIRDLFENPTIAGLAIHVEVALRDSTGLEIPPLERLPRNPATGLPDGELIPSFSQQRLWFLDQLAPGNLFYNIPIAVRLSGELNIDGLERSLNKIVDRHASLRTTFKSVDGKPIQIIEAKREIHLTVEDISHLPEPDREEAALNILVEEAQNPFNLEKGPLLRARLLKLHSKGTDKLPEHIFILVIHHIVSDGWSMGVFINELTILYESYSMGLQSDLPELKIQYFDFANWQRNWLQGEVLEQQLEYWKEKLANQPKMLNLPTDRPRPAIQTSVGDVEMFSFPKALTEKIKTLCKKENVTLFMTLLAAYQILLYRYSGQDDVSVGTAIANRNLVDTESLIGFFVNTLVMRTDLSGKPSFRELLNRVRDVTLGAYAHQDLPFEVLVEELQPDRDLSHTPLFQVAFALQNIPTTAIERIDPSSLLTQIPEMEQAQQVVQLPELELTQINIDSGTSKFDMTLSMSETDEGLVAGLEYNTDLFDRMTIQRMIGNFHTLLDEIVENPVQSISTINILTEDEEQQLISHWNQTQAMTPVDQCAHQLFEAQAARHPDEIALTMDEKYMTYAELDQRANQLAYYLQKQGVRPELLVGISAHRSLDLIVGILGVLKAGGAYLPIDPTYPEARIAFMMQDSKITVLLTQAELVDLLPMEKLTEKPVILRLDEDWDEKIADQPTSAVDSGVVPENLAYLIYTSGSTGLPKGTMLRHNGLSNLTEVQRQAFNIDIGSRILQFSALSFDASVWETFMALANGATLCLAEQEILASDKGLAQLLDDQLITNITLPPSVLRVLPTDEYAQLETVIAAGEACTPELVSRWAPDRDFFNAYGPTETTVCASMYLCDGGDQESPPIGNPILNTSLYILDEEMNLVPIGVPGELFVSGISVARGYLRRPEMTALKFIPDPFSELPGTRLYKTGDLVRYRTDGNIEFLGRIDQQVKVRGFRIELGEVEAVLNESPLVSEGTVVAREDVPGDTRLIAYFVPKQNMESEKDHGIKTSEIRQFMRRTLPEYMIPSMFISLDEIPVSPSGKVDKKALPAPDLERSALESVYVAPRTDVEVELIQISEELLGLEKVGIHDNFFELGGHSLLATQFISRVRESLAVELELRVLFESPTVADIAQVIKSAPAIISTDRTRITELLSRINDLSDEEVKEMLALKKKTANETPN